MSGAGRWLAEVALCAVFAVFLAGYFGPYLGLVPADPQGGVSGALASAYLILLFAALLTLAVRLLPGRGPAAAAGDDAGAGENAARKGSR